MLTEREIIDCLKTNLRGAADDCELLCVRPAQGPTFVRMRERLKLTEGACRQLCFWRDGDTRWLPVGMMMEAVHQKSRDWIVKHAPRIVYRKLRENLLMLLAAAEALETQATGRIGMILPEVQAAPLRASGRPMQVRMPMPRPRKTPAGLILPPGF